MWGRDGRSLRLRKEKKRRWCLSFGRSFWPCGILVVLGVVLGVVVVVVVTLGVTLVFFG